MVEVIRKEYLERLLSGKDRPDTVKIITGMRRCGKTILMKQYISHLKKFDVPDNQIIYFNFESKTVAHITNYLQLLEEIDKKYNGKRTYVFLDEIQRVEQWERAINALQTDYDADIYITGSNAYFLSGDLATYLSGRYVELNMLPLSFKEFLKLHPGDKEKRFQQFLRKGSLPVIDPEADEMFEKDHLLGIFNTVLIKDVLRNCKGGDVATLTDIVRFIYSNIGNITSANNIATSIKKDSEKVKNYLDSLKKAFLIYKVERFDIRGKKLLDTLEKYYVPDLGVRNAVLGITSRDDVGRQIENVVFLELLRRGYEISVGKYGNKEIDFACKRGNDVEYFQVSLSVMSEETYAREINPLNQIRDSYSKTLLSLDSFITDLPNGLKHINLLDWLLEEK